MLKLLRTPRCECRVEKSLKTFDLFLQFHLETHKKRAETSRVRSLNVSQCFSFYTLVCPWTPACSEVLHHSHCFIIRWVKTSVSFSDAFKDTLRIEGQNNKDLKRDHV